MYKNKKIVAIIPARGGSKGIPRKNIHMLAGKPLISYTIDIAKSIPVVDRVLVSTDDDEIANISKVYGAEVPFMRPKELALDNTPDKPVLKHAIEWLLEYEEYPVDIILFLRPTSPIRKAEDIINIVKMLVDENCDSVRSMSKVEQHPYWMYSIEDKGICKPFIPGKTMKEYYQRQLLPPVYIINGCIDAIRTDVALNSDKSVLYGDDMRGYITEGSIDIDTIHDFAVAESIIEGEK